MATRFKQEWLLRAIVESVLVVGSILLALAVDEWAEERENAELADQSLGIFEQEIRQNRARIEDLAPFHGGVRDLVGQMRTGPPTAVELRGVMEGLEAPVLLSTAWETALATGALTHMEVSVVSALSLTYSIQDRFTTQIRSERPPRLVGSASEEELVQRSQIAFEYLSTLTSGESELLAVYDQVLQVIEAHRGIGHEDTVPPPEDGRDQAHP